MSRLVLIAKTEQGNRGLPGRKKNDRKLLIDTSGRGNWHGLYFGEILDILNFFYKNEDRIFPKNMKTPSGNSYCKGRDMLYEAITELREGKNPELVKRKYMKEEGVVELDIPITPPLSSPVDKYIHGEGDK